MKITLQDLRIENFKGVKFFGIEPEGRNAVIKAENGVGKTTIYDAFLWLLFGKNSEGVSQFGIVPCDANNKAIRGIVVCVEAILDIDGKKVPIKKEMHEKVVKKQLTGYSNYYWINDVAKKEKDYSAYIKTKLIDSDVFKMLTDLTFFNGKMHWKERRAFLMTLAGAVEVKGHKDLMALVGEDRTIDEYKDILKGQKRFDDEERKEINPRIDELQKGLDEYATIGLDTTKNAETCRDALNESIAELDEQRKALIHGENDRQEKIGTVNQLKLKQGKREAELKADNSAIQALLDEKEAIGAKVLKASQGITQLEGVCSELKNKLFTEKTHLETHTMQRNKLSAAKQAVDSENCPTCKQVLPENMKKSYSDDIDIINAKGNAVFQKIKANKTAIEKIEIEMAEATETHTLAVIDYKQLTEAQFERVTELDVKIANKPTPLPERDDAWAALEKQIFEIDKSLGKPPADQLTAIETKRTGLLEEVKVLDKTLANTDTIAANTARIAELGEREKELGQKIADVEALLDEIAEYKKSESQGIELAVNDKFEHTTFKLFDYKLNGSIEETCIATYNGVDYGDMSTGQQIFVGMDIVNVLAEHYKTSCPLFLDHTESLTMDVIAKTQVIGLFAASSYMEYIPQSDGTVKEVWHDYTKLQVEIEEPEKE